MLRRNSRRDKGRGLSEIGEFELIRRLSKNIESGPGVILGIGDDAAVLKSAGEGKFVVFACDMLAEGVHFKKGTPGVKIGYKAMASNISDIAAMGGRPRYALVSIGLRKSTPLRFVESVYKGLRKAAGMFGVSIVGGDTVKSEELIVCVCLLGEVERFRLVRRSGARPGDAIFVTGSLGKGKRRHLDFVPRLKEAQSLVKNSKINSMIDISDGLAADLYRISQASRVSCLIYERLIPLARGARLEDALYGGEDFELLFSLPAKEADRLIRTWRQDVNITKIGEVRARGHGVSILEATGRIRRLKPRGFDHFLI
jgi:thiamine-monophosphate kinase